MSHFDLPNRARPVLKWAGGKSALLPQLVECFPTRFHRFLEPFMGGAAVSLTLKEGVPALLNDGNPELVAFYEVVREQPEKLMRALDRLAARYGEKFYYEVRAQKPRSPVARAARLLFLNKTGFNGLYRQNTDGQFNVPFGKRPVCPKLYDAENLHAVARRLASATLTVGDFEKTIELAKDGDLVYCDPPYEPVSRSSSFNRYVGVGFSRDDQARLKRACERAAARGATVAISNSSADYVLGLFADWHLRDINARRSINSRADRRGVVREVCALLNPYECTLPAAIRRAPAGHPFATV